MTQNVDMNCLDCLPFMRSLPDNSFALSIADPPYGIGMDSGFGFQSHECKPGDFDSNTPSLEHFQQLLRVSQTTLIFGGNFFSDKLPVSNHWIVWDKLGPMLGNSVFSDCELIWTNVPKNTVRKYTVLQRGFARTEKNWYHPTQKPVALLERLISDYAPSSDCTIFDPFAGSGSTGVAAIKLGYSFTGCELDPSYFAIANARLHQAISQPRIFDTIESELASQPSL